VDHVLEFALLVPPEGADQKSYGVGVDGFDDLAYMRDWVESRSRIGHGQKIRNLDEAFGDPSDYLLMIDDALQKTPVS
jgi:hypothetical protein